VEYLPDTHMPLQPGEKLGTHEILAPESLGTAAPGETPGSK